MATVDRVQAAFSDIQDRVGGGVAPAVLPHHRTYGSRIRRFLPSRFRVELTSRGLFARWSIDAATALGTSGPCCFVASSLSGQLSRPYGEIATFPLSTDSALHDLVSAATMASADSHHPIPTPRDVSSTRQAGGPPRVMRVTFMLMPVGFTSWRSVQVSGFTDMGLLTPLRRLYPLPVRQASTLPAASFRFRLATDTLAVRLTLPLAGRVKDFHLQVIPPATTAEQTAPVTALRAMPGAPSKRASPRPG